MDNYDFAFKIKQILEGMLPFNTTNVSFDEVDGAVEVVVLDEGKKKKFIIDVREV